MKCFVSSCDSDFHRVNKDGVSKHRFPTHPRRRNLWLQAIGKAENRRFEPENINFETTRVCSKHFPENCFDKTKKKRLRLLNSAIPVIFDNTILEINSLVSDQLDQAEYSSTSTQSPRKKNPYALNKKKLQCALELIKRLKAENKRLREQPSNDMKRTPTGHTVVRSSVLPNRNLDKTAVPLKHYDFENNDGFYNFLLEDDELPKEKKDTRAVCNCLCCRKNRMQKTYICCKRIQTEDCGDQPEALPVPIAQIDSCRLCFTTEQLEPLCSGMIVVRDEMLEKIYVCTGILIIPKPKQSMFICSPCGQLINSFHTYRQQVCSNNRAFIEHLERKAAAKAQQKMKSIHRQPAVPRKRKPPTASVTPRLKLAPETSMIVVPTEPSDCPIEIKEEPIDDPLEDASSSLLMIAANSTELSECSRSSTDLPPAIIKLPQERERSALSTCGPESNAVQVETTEDQDDLPEESWECWHCDKTFIFKFECAKHLLQNHQESVSSITTRMALDELNSNMLEMMSLHNRKSPPPVPKRVKFTQGNIARKQPNL